MKKYWFCQCQPYFKKKAKEAALISWISLIFSISIRIPTCCSWRTYTYSSLFQSMASRHVLNSPFISDIHHFENCWKWQPACILAANEYSKQHDTWLSNITLNYYPLDLVFEIPYLRGIQGYMWYQQAAIIQMVLQQFC